MNDIPFEFLAPNIPLLSVEGRSGDLPLMLVVDTGAVGPSPLFLSDAVAAKIGLSLSAPVTPERSTAIGPIRHSFRTARLPHFRLGPLALRDAVVSVSGVIDGLAAATGRPVQGIVGYGLLKDHRVAIDYVLRRISFDAPAPVTAPQPLRIAPARPITLVEAQVNGKGPFTLEIDTGASVSSFSPAAARRAGIKTLGRGRLTGAGGTVAVKVGQARMTIGGITRGLPMVNITEEIDRIGRSSGVELHGILGADFLAGTCLTLDYPAQKLWVEVGPQK